MITIHKRKDDKRNILYDEMKNMPQYVRDIFDDEYPYLLSGIDKFVINKVSNPPQRCKNQLSRWFYN